MLTTYTLDGTQTRFTFDWPYLERSHIMVTVDMAARPFKFIDDHTVEVKSLFGEPLPAGEVLKIFRVTPDLVQYAEFKDAAHLTGDDLNRARLQCLFLIQERSGGISGSVSGAVQLLVNEIETISGALDTLAFSQGVLTAGLQTLESLGSRITVVENAGEAVQAEIANVLDEFRGTSAAINERVEAVESAQNNLRASVTSQIATLAGNDLAFASRVDTVEARIDSIETEDEGDTQEQDTIAAAIIVATIAEAKSHVAQARNLETLTAQYGDVNSQLQTEKTVRASEDSALAQQITSLQVEINDNIAQVIEDMETSFEVVNGKVTNLNAQYTLKAQVQRPDGKPIMAGIALAATANNDMTGSEIVMMADRLVFADPNAPEGTLRPMFIAGSVDGSPTFIIPANSMGDRTYPGRLLVDGSIEGRSVSANTITGDKLKAGAITTREIDVNLGTNLLKASSFVDGLSGWSVSSTLPSVDTGVDLSGWTLVGGHTAWLRQTGSSGAGSTTLAADLVSDAVPVDPTERYEFSAYTGAHRCKVDLLLSFWDSNGAFLSEALADDSNTTLMGGPRLVDYKRLAGFGSPPSAAAYARLQVRKRPTSAGQPDSYVFLTQPFVAVAKPNQTRPSPWTPSGLGTRITPSGINTPYLSALSALLGDVVAGRINLTSADSQWNYLQSSGKWYRDGSNGFILARGPDGSTFLSFESGSTKLWMHSNGEAGWESPGISMTNGGLTINQLDVIDTFHVRGQAITVPALSEANGVTELPGAGTLLGLPVFGYNSGGSTVLVFVSVDADKDVVVNVYRAPGILVGSRTIKAAGLFSFTPVAGAADYNVTLSSADGSPGTISHRAVVFLTCKR